MFQRNFYLVLVILACATPGLSQSPADYSVPVSATVSTNPAQITLSWQADPYATSYAVARKSRDATSWGSSTSLPGTATSYADANVAVGSTYEYRITKSASMSGSSYTGQGYIYSGIQAPLVDSRGKVILLVDNTFSTSLVMELARLQQDLVGDGWTVLRHDVARTSSAPTIKSLIVADYSSDPANVKALLILGHVPVPYSGNFAPDGHPDHVGAWPADVYYADIDGVWTDSLVNVTTGSDPRNWNVPGDGKFDQSSLPSDVELQVGRVDLSDLPLLTQTEAELLRQYLNKDHNFRCKLIQAQARGLIDDNFGMMTGEPFAANGWRNFAPCFGAANTVAADWFTDSATQSYLWAYGCGPGSPTSASGIGTTTDFATKDPQVVFTMLFGSYFGDWGYTNDFLRAPLGTPTYTLTCAWAGRPNWLFHHMGLGETIGFSTRVTQNNSSTYTGGNFTRGVHVALMGDPTLRLHPVAPPPTLVVVTNSAGGLNLQWTASPDTVVGYHVYRGQSLAGPFTRLTTNPVTITNYTDTLNGTNIYMVRAVKLETSASGSYYNASEGTFQSLNGIASVPVPMRLSLSVVAGSIVLAGTGTPGKTYQIQAQNSFAGTNWQTLGTVTADISGAIRFVDTSHSSQRIYRTVAQ